MKHYYSTKKREQAIALLRAGSVDASHMGNDELYKLMQSVGYQWRDTDDGYRWLMTKEVEVIA